MKTYPAQFEIVKLVDDHFDVLIFSSDAVLKAFSSTYPEIVFMEKSKFAGAPICVVPDFDSQSKASVWIGYWQEALSNRENACKTCNVVQEFFKAIDFFENPNNE